MKSKRHTQDGQSTGRFVVLNFDSDVIANTAMEAINLMVVTVGGKAEEKKEIHIRAAPFIPNFRQYLENPKSNLVIYNIPAELNQSDLKELFAEFGKVLSTQVKKPHALKAGAPAPTKAPTALGYVLFEHQDEAEKAMEQANGKFLGPNQLFIQKYRTLKQRMEDNSEVLLRSIPITWKDEEVKKFVAESVGKTIEEVFAPNTQISLLADTRPETVNSHGQQAIFTCVNKAVAEEVVQKIDGMNKKFEEEGVVQEVTICAKLTRGMIACKRSEEATANKKKYADSGRNIQVFQINKDVTQDDIRAFFSKYGEIEEISAPTRKAEDINNDIFHYNVLFKTAEAADKAVELARAEEKTAAKRIVDQSKQEIRVQKYTEHHDVKSTNKHRARRD